MYAITPSFHTLPGPLLHSPATILTKNLGALKASVRRHTTCENPDNKKYQF